MNLSDLSRPGLFERSRPIERRSLRLLLRVLRALPGLVSESVRVILRLRPSESGPTSLSRPSPSESFRDEPGARERLTARPRRRGPGARPVRPGPACGLPAAGGGGSCYLHDLLVFSSASIHGLQGMVVVAAAAGEDGDLCDCRPRHRSPPPLRPIKNGDFEKAGPKWKPGRGDRVRCEHCRPTGVRRQHE